MPEHMIRKQIYLPRRQNPALKRLAKQRGISKGHLTGAGTRRGIVRTCNQR